MGVRRDIAKNRLNDSQKVWDIAVIGGGATGVGIAVDAASRGYSVCLLEQSDFGKGTSSRSTKLIHGGVRYLQQGNTSLVKESLKERGILRKNAPHLVHDLSFIVPNYAWWEAPFYGIGMKMYDLLAGEYGFGKSQHLSREQVIGQIPTIQQKNLRGGILYHDGQFDDARLLIALARTADQHGATLLNYAQVVAVAHDADGLVNALDFVDLETNLRHTAKARAIINATGPFTDSVRQLDDPAAVPMISPSQGAHVVLDRSFLPGDSAIMVPRTSDGRILFAIPWHDHVLLGTTDTAIQTPTLEPRAFDHEIDFILETAGRYLTRPPTRADIRSVFTGIRPLVKSQHQSSTALLSRDHTIHTAKSNLISIAGGKWTTYRKMAEDCVTHAAAVAKLQPRPSITPHLHIHGYHESAAQFGPLAIYGSDAPAIQHLMQTIPAMADVLHDDLPITAAQVIWSVRHEMARTVDDILARRTRALLLDSKAAIELAPQVAALMAVELQHNSQWQQQQIIAFQSLACAYLPHPQTPLNPET